jgi:hypothetical protein
MTEEIEIFEEIESFSELIVDQMLINEHGGRSYVNFNEMEELDYEEKRRIMGVLEQELCIILRRKHLSKNPYLAQMSQNIAMSIVTKRREMQM